MRWKLSFEWKHETMFTRTISREVWILWLHCWLRRANFSYRVLISAFALPHTRNQQPWYTLLLCGGLLSLRANAACIAGWQDDSHLRSAARGNLAVPATRTVRCGRRSFAVAGPSMWNSLPVPLRSCHLPSSFRRDLKTVLFIRAYHQHARDCLLL